MNTAECRKDYLNKVVHFVIFSLTELSSCNSSHLIYDAVGKASYI